MVEQEQQGPVPRETTVHHSHRRRRKRRSLRYRVGRAILVILFLAAWGFGVVKLTAYLGERGQLGKKYHDVDPAGFDASLKSDRKY